MEHNTEFRNRLTHMWLTDLHSGVEGNSMREMTIFYINSAETVGCLNYFF